MFETLNQLDCGTCELSKTCITPRMPPTGQGLRNILIVAEAPGETEDQEGIQLIGRSGMYLRRKLTKAGVNLDQDCIKTNAICCHPPGNRTPKEKEVKFCQPRLLQTIQEYQPKLIILLGGIAMKSFLHVSGVGHSSSIFQWEDYIIPETGWNCWAAPTFHPAFILRNQDNPYADARFELAIKKAVAHLNRPLPAPIDLQHSVRVFHTEEAAEAGLEGLLKKAPELLSIDYETTGLKPYIKGHEIVYISYCYHPDQAYCFRLTPGLMPLWREVLTHPKIGKIAHNMDFEAAWSRIILGVEVSPWAWDTMLATHILDNRKGTNDLKFQAYLNFGVRDYDSHISPYLKSPKDESDNAFNRVKEAPPEEIMVYCGLDSLFSYRLTLKQRMKFT